MKRTTKSLIALLVLVAMCVSFCVPVFATEPAAEHELTCPCEGKTHTLEGLGLTHDQAVAQGYLVKNVAICGEDGYSIYKCIVCPGDAYFLDNYVPADNVDHIFDESKTTTNPADCYNSGSVNKFCTRCEQWINETLPALGHEWERAGASEGWEYTKDGVTVDTYYCTDGDVTKTRTCECGYVDGPYSVAGGDHTWGEGYYITYPTCIDPATGEPVVGKYHVFCTECDYEKTVDVFVDKNNPKHHDWKYDVTADGYVAPTCTTKGTAVDAVCKNCGAVAETLEIDEIAHDYSEDVTYIGATCFTAGRTAGKKCACGADDPANTSVVIPAIAHGNAVKIDAESVAASCYPGTAPVDPELVGVFIPYAEKPDFDANIVNGVNKGWGMDVYSCPDCAGAKYVKFVAPSAHPSMDSITVLPTHDDYGMVADACSKCGYYVSVTILTKYTHEVSLDYIPTNMVKVDAESTEPDCVNNGTYVYKCTACEADGIDFKASLSISATGHSYALDVVPATCVSAGWSWMKCSCGDIDKTVDGCDTDGKFSHTAIDPINGHVKVVDITTKPTCTETGLSLESCDLCDWIATKADGSYNYVTVPALNHANSTVTTTEPTCTVAGTVKTVCNETWTLVDGTVINCPYEKTTAGAAATGHSWKTIGADGNPIGTIYEVVAPNCTQKGYTRYCCTNTNCPDAAIGGAKSPASRTTGLSLTPALGHTYESLEKTRENADQVILPSCTAPTKHGQLVFICTRGGSDCTDAKGKTLKIDMDPSDPDYSFNINNHLHHAAAYIDPLSEHYRPGNCLQTPIDGYVCTACDRDFGEVKATKTHVDYKLPTGDDFPGVGVNDNAVSNSCVSAGKYETFLCGSVCGAKYYIKDGVCYRYTDPAEAVIAKTGHQKSATDCTVCVNGCGLTDATLTHTSVTDAAVEETCTSTGLTAGSHCSVCSKVIVPQYEIPAKDHPIKTSTPVAPLCEDPGHTWVECDVCREVLYFDFFKPALGHDYSVPSAESYAPSCIAPGMEYHECSRCGELDAGVEIPMLNAEGVHVNAAGQKFKDSCVDINGIIVTDFYCTNAGCGYVSVTHTTVTKIVTEDCTKNRYQLTICTICKADDTTLLPPRAEHDWSAQGIWAVDGEIYGVVATRAAAGYNVRYCLECEQLERVGEGNTGDIKQYITYANDGIDFNFELTNKKGVVEEDGYAGTIQLVIDTVALNAYVKTLNLRVTFDSSVLQFVGGELAADCGFEEVENLTFTDTEAAKNGYVSIVVSSLNNDNVQMKTGRFAVLEFRIKNTKAAGVSLDFFNVDASVTEAKNKDNALVDSDFYFADSMADAKTVVLGKLVDDGEPIGVADFNEMVSVYLAGDAGYRSEADIDGNGEVNAVDFNIIRSYLLGNDPVELKPIV